ncbi:hypothetical protein C8F04DRAFT_1235564 [Mycena alexandri]|uniref:Uncharacterized protein n=1 Tax=Mycena alexandri TaxID=1745969 RepID=A0AAD6SQX8_9AGAR|nr:hypothetical protein C8F04DRAFT_1235564 [Mycena alexandri]
MGCGHWMASLADIFWLCLFFWEEKETREDSWACVTVRVALLLRREPRARPKLRDSRSFLRAYFHMGEYEMIAGADPEGRGCKQKAGSADSKTMSAARAKHDVRRREQGVRVRRLSSAAASSCARGAVRMTEPRSLPLAPLSRARGGMVIHPPPSITGAALYHICACSDTTCLGVARPTTKPTAPSISPRPMAASRRGRAGMMREDADHGDDGREERDAGRRTAASNALRRGGSSCSFVLCLEHGELEAKDRDPSRTAGARALGPPRSLFWTLLVRVREAEDDVKQRALCVLLEVCTLREELDFIFILPFIPFMPSSRAERLWLFHVLLDIGDVWDDEYERQSETSIRELVFECSSSSSSSLARADLLASSDTIQEYSGKTNTLLKRFDYYAAYFAAGSRTTNTTADTIISPVQSARPSMVLSAKRAWFFFEGRSFVGARRAGWETVPMRLSRSVSRWWDATRRCQQIEWRALRARECGSTRVVHHEVEASTFRVHQTVWADDGGAYRTGGDNDNDEDLVSWSSNECGRGASTTSAFAFAPWRFRVTSALEQQVLGVCILKRGRPRWPASAWHRAGAVGIPSRLFGLRDRGLALLCCIVCATSKGKRVVTCLDAWRGRGWHDRGCLVRARGRVEAWSWKMQSMALLGA